MISWSVTEGGPVFQEADEKGRSRTSGVSNGQARRKGNAGESWKKERTIWQRVSLSMRLKKLMMMFLCVKILSSL